jgi:quercetin dioxygenase-like cupin family protein
MIMNQRKLRMAAAGVVAALIGVWGIQSIQAQQPGFKRTELQRHDLSTPGREMVQVRAEFEPAGAVGKHTHPGEEVGYVLEGSVEFEVEGKPRTTLKAGDSFFIPAGTVHAAKNAGNTSAKVLATYIVEKGKPLATPAAVK